MLSPIDVITIKFINLMIILVKILPVICFLADQLEITSPVDSIIHFKSSQKLISPLRTVEKKQAISAAPTHKAQSRKRKRKDKATGDSEHDKSPISGILIKRIKQHQKGTEKEEETSIGEKAEEPDVIKSGDIDSK